MRNRRIAPPKGGASSFESVVTGSWPPRSDRNGWTSLGITLRPARAGGLPRYEPVFRIRLAAERGKLLLTRQGISLVVLLSQLAERASLPRCPCMSPCRRDHLFTRLPGYPAYGL